MCQFAVCTPPNKVYVFWWGEYYHVDIIYIYRCVFMSTQLFPGPHVQTPRRPNATAKQTGPSHNNLLRSPETLNSTRKIWDLRGDQLNFGSIVGTHPKSWIDVNNWHVFTKNIPHRFIHQNRSSTQFWTKSVKQLESSRKGLRRKTCGNM
jgi:hypothetical protein